MGFKVLGWTHCAEHTNLVVFSNIPSTTSNWIGKTENDISKCSYSFGCDVGIPVLPLGPATCPALQCPMGPATEGQGAGCKRARQPTELGNDLRSHQVAPNPGSLNKWGVFLTVWTLFLWWNNWGNDGQKGNILMNAIFVDHFGEEEIEGNDGKYWWTCGFSVHLSCNLQLSAIM